MVFDLFTISLYARARTMIWSHHPVCIKTSIKWDPILMLFLIALKMDPERVHFQRDFNKMVQKYPILDHFDPILDHFGPKLANFGHFWPIFGQNGSILGAFDHF